MREFTISKKDDGRRLEKWLPSAAPGMNFGAVRKAIRLKRIRINGKVAKDGACVAAGDIVQIYLEDSYFEEAPRENRLLAGFRPHIDVLYEDENILLVDKRPGLRVHPDGEEKVDTLVTHVQAHLYQKGEYDAKGFAPALCNRIDRFTGGIVIAAKNSEALHIMDRKVRDREIEKYYLCACAGRLSPEEGTLRGYLIKEGKRVKALKKNAPGAQYAETGYRVLTTAGGVSLVECRLVTGRTHQIRVQFAAAGHPLIGDTQYGDREFNSRFSSNFQQLYAYRLKFDFKTDAGILEYLNGKSFQVHKLHRGFEEIEKMSRGAAKKQGLDPR